jgi:hypothetical protein
MENKNNKEAIVINFDGVEMKVSHQKVSHLDADIYEDGTCSLRGIGKKPKEIDTQKMNWASDEGYSMKDYSTEEDGLRRLLNKKWISKLLILLHIKFVDRFDD